MSGVEQSDLMALDLEYRLTIAHRLGCECGPYFVQRREVLIPEMLKEAARRGEDPVDVFAAFARKVHLRKCGTTTAGRYAALMALASSEDEHATPPTQPRPTNGGAS